MGGVRSMSMSGFWSGSGFESGRFVMRGRGGGGGEPTDPLL